MHCFLSAQFKWEDKVDSEIKLAYLYKLQAHKFAFKDGNYTLDDLRVAQPKECIMNLMISIIMQVCFVSCLILLLSGND